MITVRTVAQLRAHVAQVRAEGKSVGLVPTMGAFHEGHLSLMRRARAQQDVVVVSLFVNPIQFGEQEDLSTYPRTEATDIQLAQEAGVDVLFIPSVQEMYPAGFATSVQVSGVTEILDGEHRGRHHFDGVATVVTKLFGMAQPDVAYFGQKDAQQIVVVQQVVRDLNLPVRIEPCPTIRELDGLAMSSRNTHLSPQARRQAAAIPAALWHAEQEVARGATSTAQLQEQVHASLLAAEIEPEYVAVCSPTDLQPVAHLREPALLLVAAYVGGVRLIDNTLLFPPL